MFEDPIAGMQWRLEKNPNLYGDVWRCREKPRIKSPFMETLIGAEKVQHRTPYPY